MRHLFPGSFSFRTLWGTLAGVLLVGVPAQAQAPPWRTAVASVGHFCSVKATAIGSGGDVYLVGSFSGTAHFGAISLTSTENVPGVDAFVAKWSPASQQFVWVKRIGGSESDEAQAVVVQGRTLYVAGRFSSPSVQVGSITLTNADTVARGHRIDKETADVFVVKLTDAGSTATVTWAQRAGGLKDDTGNSLAVNGAQLYLLGHSSSPVSHFGPCSLPASRTGQPAEEEPIKKQFVAKLTDTGPTSRFDWVVPTSGSQEASEVGAVAVQGTSVYVVGNPEDNDELNLFRYSSTTTDGPYVTKLTDTGASARPVWTQRLARGSLLSAMAVSGPNVYLAGSFWRDTLRLAQTVLLKTPRARDNADNGNSFVAKLTDVGTSAGYAWVQQAGGPGGCNTSGLAVTGARVYVTGRCWGPVRFGTVRLLSGPSEPLTLYVARLTDSGPTGRYDWVSAVGPPPTYVPPSQKPQAFYREPMPIEVNTLAVSGSHVYIAGGFNGQLQFGTRVLTFAVLTNLAAFLASLTDTGR